MNKLVLLAMVGCSAPVANVDPRPVVEPVAQPVKVVEPPPAPVRAWPATRTESVTDELHGKAISDPYRWLEDEQVTEVQTWMTAQDTYARGELAKLPNREDYEARLAKLMYYDATYAP